jgi:hypothetical protein
LGSVYLTPSSLLPADACSLFIHLLLVALISCPCEQSCSECPCTNGCEDYVFIRLDEILKMLKEKKIPVSGMGGPSGESKCNFIRWPVSKWPHCVNPLPVGDPSLHNLTNFWLSQSL